MLTTGTYPVRHLVLDDFVSPAPDWAAPTEWECRYDNDCERGKQTTRDLPWWARAVADRMMGIEILELCARLFGGPLAPDPTLYGGGLQLLSPGGWLNCHLDGALYPDRPNVCRAVQLVCFVHPAWRAEWGGAFVIYEPDGRTVATRVSPVPGRLVAFESRSDLAYHGTEVTSPDAAKRVTVAMSFLAPATPSDTRRRALFVPNR